MPNSLGGNLSFSSGSKSGSSSVSEFGGLQGLPPDSQILPFRSTDSRSGLGIDLFDADDESGLGFGEAAYSSAPYVLGYHFNGQSTNYSSRLGQLLDETS